MGLSLIGALVLRQAQDEAMLVVINDLILSLSKEEPSN